MVKIEYFQGADDQWRWRLRSKNHRIIADGAEGYETLQSVQRAVMSFSDKLGGVPVVKVEKTVKAVKAVKAVQELPVSEGEGTVPSI